MMTDRAPWTGTLTALAFPSPNKIERCMAQAIRKSTYTWTPTQLLLMLPNKETEKLVCRRFLPQVLR
jgi:hypothetical protein